MNVNQVTIGGEFCPTCFPLPRIFQNLSRTVCRTGTQNSQAQILREISCCSRQASRQIKQYRPPKFQGCVWKCFYAFPLIVECLRALVCPCVELSDVIRRVAFRQVGFRSERKTNMHQATQATETAGGVPKFLFTERHKLLRGVSQPAVHRFNAMMRTSKRRRGEWIFVLGDPADSIYFLQEGRIKITALSEDGHEVLHEIIGPDEIFGEISTILGIPRTTSAQTLESSLLCEMSRKDFESLLTMYPEMSLQLIKSVGLRLKKSEAHLLNLICNDVSTRVRQALLELVDFEPGAESNRPVRIGITQQDLANLIGASRQKTWQALKELEDWGILRLSYGSILVTAAHKLRNAQVPEETTRPRSILTGR